MWIGAIEFDLLLSEVHSLKQKRSAVRPLIAQLRRQFEISVAQVGYADLYRRALIGATVVGRESGPLVDVLDQLERMVVARPEVELLQARRSLITMDDE